MPRLRNHGEKRLRSSEQRGRSTSVKQGAGDQLGDYSFQVRAASPSSGRKRFPFKVPLGSFTQLAVSSPVLWVFNGVFLAITFSYGLFLVLRKVCV